MTDPLAELDEPAPQIKITCTSTDCDNDLHCFLQKRTLEGAPVFGRCRACEAEPAFDINRVRRRKESDIAYTFKALRHEKIRAHMWAKPIDDAAMAHAHKKGRIGLHAAIASRLRSSIGKKAGGFDGRQTKMEGNVIFYAQHSTATCCRKCLAYWHDIPKDHDLTDRELAYCEALVAAYIDERLPELDDLPSKVND